MPSTRKITTKPAATAKPVKPAKAVKPVAAVTTEQPAAAVVAVAKPSANITRTAATVAKQATNFGTLSDRDTAYLGFYRRLAAALPGNVVTIAGIVASGLRPPHVGSNKPHDAGVIVRGIKAGLYAPAGADGHSFTVTKLGNETKAG